MEDRRKHGKWFGLVAVLWAGIVLHVVTALSLLVYELRIVPTSLGDLQGFLSQPILGALLLIAAGLTWWGMQQSTARRALSLFALQQSLLTVSSISAVTAIISGHYADGVARPMAFILVDQLPMVMIAVLHSFAVVSFARKLPWKR